MDNLQYLKYRNREGKLSEGFKPYYKWITFNTFVNMVKLMFDATSFKPYYKWITFNTQ